MKKFSVFHLFRKYGWPLRKLIMLLIVINFIGNLIAAVQPVIFAGVMNIIIRDNSQQTSNGSRLLDLNQIGSRVMKVFSSHFLNTWSLLTIMSLLFILIVVISSFSSYMALVLGSKIEASVKRSLQLDLLKKMFSMNLGFFNQQKSGELMSRIIQDASSTAIGLGPLISSFLQNSILILMYSLYLINTNMMLTCAALFLILLQFGLTQIVRKPMMKVIRTNLDRNAELSNLLQESFTSVRVMKSFGGEEYELAKIGEGITALVKSDVRSNIVKHLQDPVRLVLDSVAMVGIVLIAAQQLMKGNLSLQGFVLFIYVGQLLVNPINKFAVTISWAHALLASYSRLSNIFKIEPQVLDGSKDKDHFVDAINVKDVKFDYGGGPVLHNISFEIKKNEIIAIVGPSGAGKSTLVDLIMRFYDPTNGSIFIDTLDLKQIRYDSYRKIFGVVPQRNILFNDTIRNNILYGRNFLSENDVLEAIRISNAEEFIKNMPKGLDTVVGEKGVFLSGGQCQRIAIARAVVSRPDILILDEATSSLDSEAEKQVQKAIDMALENSTAIIIAHRLSTVLHAHKIVVMQKGRIEAMGRHSELLEISPTYKLLYSLQFQDWRKDDKANGYAGR